MSKGKQPKTSV